MKKLLVAVCVICILLSMTSISTFAADLETKEFQGKTYINVTSKAVLDSLIADMIEKREEKLDVYCYHETRDWEDRYAKDVRNFTGIGKKCEFGYLEYTVGSVSLYTYPKFIGDGQFTQEAYGTIEIRYLDTKEETAKADAVIDKVLSEISSYSLHDKLKYIADYVCKSTAYGSIQMEGGGYDMINGAWDVLSGVRTNTVCTSYAVTFQRFMDRAGIPCTMICNDNHIWNMVCIDGLWYGIDCTSDDGDCIAPGSFLMGKKSLARYPAGALDPVGTFAKNHEISPTDYGKATPPTTTPPEDTSTTPPKPDTSKPVTPNRPSTEVKPEPENKEPAPEENTTGGENVPPETTVKPESENKAEDIKADITENTTVKAELFKNAADTGVTLKLEGEKYSWTFSADALSAYTASEDFDAAVFTGEELQQEQVDTIQKAAKSQEIYPFSFAHHGKLPAVATVRIRVATEYAGKRVQIYSLDENNEPVLESTATVSGDSVLTFDTNHCSLWYITHNEDISGNGINWLWPVLGVAALAAGVAVFFFIKRKNSENR